MKTIMYLFMVSFFFSACGGYNTSTIQKDEVGQLKLVGNISQISLSVDDGDLIVVEKPDLIYRVKPGNHNIKIFRNNKVIINRNLFFDTSAIMEVAVQ